MNALTLQHIQYHSIHSAEVARTATEKDVQFPARSIHWDTANSKTSLPFHDSSAWESDCKVGRKSAKGDSKSRVYDVYEWLLSSCPQHFFSISSAISTRCFHFLDVSRCPFKSSLPIAAPRRQVGLSQCPRWQRCPGCPRCPSRFLAPVDLALVMSEAKKGGHQILEKISITYI